MPKGTVFIDVRPVEWAGSKRNKDSFTASFSKERCLVLGPSLIGEAVYLEL